MKLRILLVEDSNDDAELMLRELTRAGHEVEHARVEGANALTAALDEADWDIVLADYSLPSFGGIEALGIVRARRPDTPFIIVSGVIGEETAVHAMKAGAQDYVTKGRLKRLAPAVEREVREARARGAHRRTLEDAHRRLRLLSERMIEVQETERRRLASELHDEIGQALTAVKLNLQQIAAGSGGHAGSAVDDSLAVVDGALQQVRALSLDLRPPQLDDLGLNAALRSQLDRMTKPAGVAVRFRTNDLGGRLQPGIESACYRIFQEAVTNILRHAAAQAIEVELLLSKGELHLLVADDGAGFDVEGARERALHGGSMGIAGMEERAQLVGGRLEIRSANGVGTKVSAVFPAHYVADA